MEDAARALADRHAMAALGRGQIASKYRPLLRALGAFFDQQEASNITLADIDSGFIWHFFPRGDLLHPRHGLITYQELPNLAVAMKRTRLDVVARMRQQKRSLLGWRQASPPILYSSGYEEALRSLGHMFDTDRVTNILLTESDGKWAVSTCLPVPPYVQSNPVRLHEGNYFHDTIYSHEDLVRLSASVRGLRGKVAT